MQCVLAVFAGILLLSGLGKNSSVVALAPTADIWEDVLYLAEQGVLIPGRWLRRPCGALLAAVGGTEQLGAAAPLSNCHVAHRNAVVLHRGRGTSWTS
jgi:hypothetical protein